MLSNNWLKNKKPPPQRRDGFMTVKSKLLHQLQFFDNITAAAQFVDTP